MLGVQHKWRHNPRVCGYGQISCDDSSEAYLLKIVTKGLRCLKNCLKLRHLSTTPNLILTNLKPIFMAKLWILRRLIELWIGIVLHPFLRSENLTCYVVLINWLLCYYYFLNCIQIAFETVYDYIAKIFVKLLYYINQFNCQIWQINFWANIYFSALALGCRLP